MLSRLANAGRRGLRRYATGTSGGNPTGAPKPAGQSSGAVVPPVASTWLAKKAQLNAGSIGTRLACLAVLGVSGYAIYDQYGMNLEIVLFQSSQSLLRATTLLFR